MHPHKNTQTKIVKDRSPTVLSFLVIRTKWKVHFLSTVKEANRKKKIYSFSSADHMLVMEYIL